MFEQSYVHKGNPRAHYMGARFTEEERVFINKCAEKREKTTSDLFRMAIKEELKEELIEMKGIEFKIFYVLPECEYYQEDGSCKRCSSDKYKYGCNEIWCEKKVEYELQLNESKEQSCKECTFFDEDAQMGESHCKLKGSICISGEEFKKKEQTKQIKVI